MKQKLKYKNNRNFVLLVSTFVFVLVVSGCNTFIVQDNKQISNSRDSEKYDSNEMQTRKDLQTNSKDRLVESYFSTLNPIKKESIKKVSMLSDEIDTRSFLSLDAFKDGISGSYTSPFDGYAPLDSENYNVIRGGIIPHHAVANIMIADFYKTASKKGEYDLIVVISPNHKSLGHRFQIVEDNYYTYEGVVEVDKPLVYQLSQIDELYISEREVIGNEHGQLVHMPYIAHFFPETKVISLIITELRDGDGIEKLVEGIDRVLADKNVLFIASIDFSHYLTLDEANTNDKVTEMHLINNDVKSMIHLSNDFIDSPSTYMMFAEFMKRQNMSKTTITNHSNSAIILKDPMMYETTSYFQVVVEDDELGTKN